MVWLTYTHCSLRADLLPNFEEVLSRAEREILPLFTKDELTLYTTSQDFPLFRQGHWQRLRQVEHEPT